MVKKDKGEEAELIDILSPEGCGFSFEVCYFQ
jgi:hypothetical protein